MESNINPYNFALDSYGFGSYGGNANYPKILEELKSGDEMRIYSAILELSQNLPYAQENTMNDFSIDAYVEAINAIINSPTYSDVSSEIAFHSISSLISIMEIFPSSVNTIINKSNENGSIIGALSSKIQNLEYIDVAEKAIKALERISLESAASVLNGANLDLIFNITDFFELNTQIVMLKMVSNICVNINREEDFKKLIPMIPTLTNFFEIRGTTDKHTDMFNLICTSFQFIWDCPLKFKDPYSNLTVVSDNFKLINQYGLMDKWYQFLLAAWTSAKFTSDTEVKPSSDDTEDTKSSIIIGNLGKIIKIISLLCKYSSEHWTIAIMEMNMLEIIETLLKREYNRNKDSISVLTETISLLSALIPDSRSYKNDTSDFAKNEKAKSFIFEDIDDQPNQYCVTMIKSILPMMLKLYVSSFNQTNKFSFLQLIEEIVLMMSSDTLKKYLQPHLMSRFIITTMKTENYNWIESWLRILWTKKLNFWNLSLHREGIQEYLKIYSDKNKFRELTGIQIQDDEPPKEEKPVKNEIKEEPNENAPAKKTPEKADFAVETKIAKQMVDQIQKDEIKRLEDTLEIEKQQFVQQKPDSEKQVFIEVKPELKPSPKNVKNESEKDQEKPSESDSGVTSQVTKVAEEIKEAKIAQKDDIISVWGEIDKSAKQDKPQEAKEEVDPEQKVISDQEGDEEIITTDPSLSKKVSDLKEQKEYINDLKMAIKESMREMDRISSKTKADSTLLKDEEGKQKQSSSDEKARLKKKMSSHRKAKKILNSVIANMDNLDEGLEKLEEIGDFEEEELERIKDIIVKKKLLNKSKDTYNYESRKYSRDFIGMHSAPLYK